MNPHAPPPDAPADTRPSSQRARAGYRKATISILIGLFGMFATCCGLGALLSGRILRARAPAAAITPLVDLPVPASRTPIPFAPREEAAWVRSIALHRFGGPLRLQLADQVTAARGKGEIVLVETIATDCDACDQIDRAMREPSVQAALSKIRLVYVPMGEFHSELGWLRMDESTAPWFYLLDARGEPRDAIGADEWDDNEAVNIGPILHAFVQGELRKRRHDWHGGATL